VQTVIVVQVQRPAIGLRHGGVHAVLQAAQDADHALVIGLAVATLDPHTRAEFFQHVVHRGQGEHGVGGMLRLALSIDFLAKE
jgi:hypothetical protein